MRRRSVDVRRRRRRAFARRTGQLPSRTRSPPCLGPAAAARASRTARRLPRRCAPQRGETSPLAGSRRGWAQHRATCHARQLRDVGDRRSLLRLSRNSPRRHCRRPLSTGESVIRHVPSPPPNSPTPEWPCGHRPDATCVNVNVSARDGHVALKNYTATEGRFFQSVESFRPPS